MVGALGAGVAATAGVATSTGVLGIAFRAAGLIGLVGRPTHSNWVWNDLFGGVTGYYTLR